MLDLEYSRGAFSQSVLVVILVLSAWHIVGPPNYLYSSLPILISLVAAFRHPWGVNYRRFHDRILFLFIGSHWTITLPIYLSNSCCSPVGGIFNRYPLVSSYASGS